MDGRASRQAMLLVHGGRHGGWCWDRMVEPLRAGGYEVVAPTLLGMGERRDQLRCDIDLTAHVGDLAAFVEARDLTDAVLVAHSYGGMVGTALADRMPERFASIVYLDAVVGRDGCSVLDLIPPSYVDAMLAAVAADGDGWRLPAGPALLEQYGVRDPDDVAWALPQLSDQPFATYREPVRLTGAVEGIPRAFVWFSRSTVVPPENADVLRADPGFAFVELAVEHDAIVTDAERIAEVVLTLARSSRPA